VTLRARSQMSAHRRSRTRHPSTLDSRALEAVQRFVRVLARYGCTPEDIAREVTNAVRQIPRSWASRAMAALCDPDDAGHVLTLWFSDPAYLDFRGNPRPLPFRGAGGSLEALARRVDRNLEAREVLKFLVRHGGLKRVGTRYVPRDRKIILRRAGGPLYFRNLRGLLGMLRTLEHNSQPKRRVPGWFEALAANPSFPVSARQAFEKRLGRLAWRFLYHIDADMHRRERERKPDEQTVRLGVGVYRFEEGPLPRGRNTRRHRPSR